MGFCNWNLKWKCTIKLAWGSILACNKATFMCILHLYKLTNDKLIYNYFMAMRRTVKLLSQGSGEDLGNCCQRPKRQWFDCSPRSLEITVLLPNCFKSPTHCQKYADARHWRRDIWGFVTSFVTWPVNSFFCCLLPRSCKSTV